MQLGEVFLRAPLRVRQARYRGGLLQRAVHLQRAGGTEKEGHGERG